MASATVNTNPLKDGSSKFNQSTSGKKPKAGVKAGTKAAKNPGSSSRSQKSGRGSGKEAGKKRTTGRTKESRGGSSRDRSKSGSKRKSGSSSSGSQKKGAGSKNSKGGMSRSETIKLSCGPDVYYVSSRHFAACSNLIKKHIHHTVASALSLSC
ncbi:hypothetical protein PRIPAC_73995 [Pristionchus pacificus]|uniref:Uncharacterized protein n=1 Tax=Pristionchus pacificus TaxID=54126 RepID=A0A2A6C128_PRIPA|nr:hypothetical protein PRIPAC_73995 [Pristionchus pacificus]|eukprot:PDM71875.1 hypothetical protein PRIPAC_38282 [Pristionchus pacificus]